MTGEQLITEGRKLQKPSVFLRPEPVGEVAAIWHELDKEGIQSTGFQRWITVDSRFIPELPSSVKGCLSVFSDEDECEGGKVEIFDQMPAQDGIKLYAHAASVLPPLDAVMLKGSAAVGEWLKSKNWQRDWGYNGNFKDEAAKAYQDVWFDEHPIYKESDVYAILGGWHFLWPDGDWPNLFDDKLMIFTLRNSEPWMEAWLMKTGEYKVFQRIT